MNSHIIFPFASLFNKTCLNNQSIKMNWFLGKEIKLELDKSETFRILSTLSNILIVFNSSINFFIYLMKDPKLAEQKETVCISVNSCECPFNRPSFIIFHFFQFWKYILWKVRVEEKISQQTKTTKLINNYNRRTHSVHHQSKYVFAFFSQY